jgi:hypothetical protein
MLVARVHKPVEAEEPETVSSDVQLGEAPATA